MALLTPQTGSIIEVGGANTTRTALSTNIIIKVGNLSIGAVQNFSINETRTITAIDEVGYDGHIDSVPTKSTDIEGSCSRIRFDKLRVTEAFGRGYFHLHAMRIPFDIVIIDRWINADDNTAVTTTIKNVWFKKISYSYKKDDWIITDDVDWQAEAIYSTVNGTNAANGGEGRVPNPFIDQIEREADRGARRGALSNIQGAPTLINSVFSNF